MSYPTPQRRRIQPKLRAMPSRRTPSALYMQMHQLANEKERLQQELALLHDRQQQITTRLKEIDQALAHMDSTLTDLANPFQAEAIKELDNAPKYETMTIDY